MVEGKAMTIPEEDAKMRRDLNRRSAELAFGGWAALPATVGGLISALETINGNYDYAARAGIATVIASVFMGTVGLLLSKDYAREIITRRRYKKTRGR